MGRATWATDPESAKQSPPVLRAPNGVLQDLRTYWVAGKAQYDPGDIKEPTLIILPSGTPTCRATRRAAISPS